MNENSGSIPDYVLNEIKCCLHEDPHILLEPVLLKCGGNACKGCINDIIKSSFKCLKCNSTHNKNDFIENKSTETFIRFLMKDLSENLNNEIKKMKGLLSGWSKLNIFILKFTSFKL
jgi:hypothetical protein